MKTFIILSSIISTLLIVLPQIIAPKTNTYEKRSAYECGFEPFGNTKINFDVHFYVVAVLFLIFDLEISYLLPWVLNFHQLTTIGFFTIIFFLLILIAAFFLE